MFYEMPNTATVSLSNAHEGNCDCPEELTECLRNFRRTRFQDNVVCGTAHIKGISNRYSVLEE